MTVYVFTFPKYQTEQITGTFFGVLYAPVMLSCIYELRGLENGVYLVWLDLSWLLGLRHMCVLCWQADRKA